MTSNASERDSGVENRSETPSRHGSLAHRIRSQIGGYGVVGALVVAIAVFSVWMPALFLTEGNILSMLSSEAVILLLAGGVTLTLRIGDLDLSFGAVANLSAVVAAVLSNQAGLSTWFVLLVCVVVGLLAGLLNGLLVVGLGLNSFVATLGVMTLVQGVTYGVTNSKVVTVSLPGVLSFSNNELLGINLAVWYSWILVAILWFAYRYMIGGRYLLFVGGNRRAAALAGIRVTRVRWGAYCLSGMIFGFAGAVLAGTLGSADPSIGGQYLLPPLAAAFLGSTTIQPGRFNAIGTLVGAYLLMVISTGLQLAGLASWVGDVFNGAALIGAIAFARIMTKRSGKGSLA